MAPSILPQSCGQDLESNHLDLPTTFRMPVANKGLKFVLDSLPKKHHNPAGEWHVRGLNPNQEGFEKKDSQKLPGNQTSGGNKNRLKKTTNDKRPKRSDFLCFFGRFCLKDVLMYTPLFGDDDPILKG